MAVSKQNLVIFRDDHIGDPIGAIFLDLDDSQGEVARRVRQYLGGKARILKIELGRDRATVEVEASIFTEESIGWPPPPPTSTARAPHAIRFQCLSRRLNSIR